MDSATNRPSTYMDPWLPFKVAATWTQRRSGKASDAIIDVPSPST